MVYRGMWEDWSVNLLTSWIHIFIYDLKLPFKGDTVIGNDVWIGQNVMIMPGGFIIWS